MSSSEVTPPLGRRPGRPKGSKNGPNAGAVGRPRKDGSAPRNRKHVANGSVSVVEKKYKSDNKEQSNASSSSSISYSLAPAESDSGLSRSVSVSISESHVGSVDVDVDALPTQDGDNAEMTPLHLGTPTDDLVATTPPLTIKVPPTATISKKSQSLLENSTSSSVHLETTGLADHIPDIEVENPLPSTSKSNVTNLHIFGNEHENKQTMDTNFLEDEGEDDDIFAEAADGANGDDLNEFEPIPDDEETLPPPSTSGSNTSLPPSEKPRQLRSSIPLWLIQNYEDIRECLTAEIRKNVSGKPTCYDNGSFTHGSSNPFFATCHRAQPKPHDFYKPQFDVWLPHLLTNNQRIICPGCSINSRKGQNGQPIYLCCQGWAKAPRRVVDVDRCIFLIGYRYYCPHSECKKTYLSWSPALLSALPRWLGMQFNYHLTYRGGLSDRVVAMMRSSFLHGTGPTPFSQMLRTNHIRRYEHLHLQYLELIHDRQYSSMAKFLAKFELFGEFNDRECYAGFVHSPQYFRNFYIKYISNHATSIDKHMAMLSGRILQIDASFKVPKHLGKLQGVAVFPGGLNTANNEYSEVRYMNFASTKSQSQFIPAITAVSESLATYGHDPIELIFTDNPRSDGPAIEEAIPSLRNDVVSVPDPTKLRELTLPPTNQIVYLSSTYQINTRFDMLLDSEELRQNKSIYVALDMEWPVNTVAGISGHVALISMTLGDEIYLIPLNSYYENGSIRLPHALLTFFRADQIRKIGVHVQADLKKLFRDCGFIEGQDAPFSGATELGRVAKDKNIVTRANVSLADLVSSILRQYLPKDPSIRVSEDWNNTRLSDRHANYAALDVYAIWRIFKALASFSIGETIDENSPLGSMVSLYSSDNSRVVAFGNIAPERPKSEEGINITKTRTLVIITSVLVPGYVIPGDLLPSHRNTPLGDFPIPFRLVCKSKNLRSQTDSGTNSNPSHSPTGTCTTVLYGTSTNPTEGLSESPCVAFPLDHSSETVPQDSDENLLTGTLSTPSWYNNHSDLEDDENTQNLSSSRVNAAAELQAKTITEKAESNLQSNNVPHSNNPIRTRILGDIRHLFDQFPISVHHGLSRPFAHAMQLAFFMLDTEDKTNVEAFLADKGLTLTYMMKFHSTWVLRRIRRVVPPPEILLPRCAAVLRTYGPLEDAKTHEPLFSQAAWDIAKNVLENIRRGYYSDPPNISLYYPRFKDKNGLQLYRCCRGTNGIEGGIHQNIIRWFGAFNASPEFAVELLRDYCLFHNLMVGTRNRTGKAYLGSFDIWSKNRISELTNVLVSHFKSPPQGFGSTLWVNGDQYVSSKEKFGILPLPEHTRAHLGMLEFHPHFAHNEKIRYPYLAAQQNTRVPVVPIHTKAERLLFKALLDEKNGLFSGKQQPNWDTLTIQWGSHSDGVHIFYKLPEHLKNYWKRWQDNVNEKATITINEAAYRELERLLMPTAPRIPGYLHAPPPTQPQPLGVQVSKGKAKATDSSLGGEVTSWDIGKLLSQHSGHRFAIDLPYGESPPVAPKNSLADPRPNAKRAQPHENDNGKHMKPVKKRRDRTCPRCRRTDCEGKWNSKPCHRSTT